MGSGTISGEVMYGYCLSRMFGLSCKHKPNVFRGRARWERVSGGDQNRAFFSQNKNLSWFLSLQLLDIGIKVLLSWARLSKTNDIIS